MANYVEIVSMEFVKILHIIKWQQTIGTQTLVSKSFMRSCSPKTAFVEVGGKTLPLILTQCMALRMYSLFRMVAPQI